MPAVHARTAAFFFQRRTFRHRPDKIVSNMPEMTLQQAFERAVQHHSARELQPAEALYRQILIHEPRHAAATHFLGLLAYQAGKPADAVTLIRSSIALGLNTPDVYGNLGNALRATGQLDEAITAFGQSLALAPHFAPTWVNLGNALLARGDIDQAIDACRQAIALDPRLPEACNSLAVALTDQRQFDQAIDACRQAIALRSEYTDAHINLGNALKASGQLDLAINAYRHAAALNPNVPEIHSNLGGALKEQGLPDEAIAAYRQAADINGADPRHGSNLILLLNYHPGYDARFIWKEADRWNRQHALPLVNLVRPHFNNPDPDRRLRIGYVSPDFRDHVVGRNVLPLLRRHDHSRFHITCYSLCRPDEFTREFEQLADTWRTIGFDLPDEQLAEQIRDDQIDILVDLALHTSGNRLLVFARKPAPVAVTFAGYPGTTGVSAIDYRFSDPFLDPPGVDESVYTEKTIRLSDTFWCYDPLECRDIPTSPLPSQQSGVVTFGCLNNFSKANDEMLAIWAKVLQQIANARLLLSAPSGTSQANTLALFERFGVQHQRIEFISNLPRREYMTTYRRIDIGLDSYPYNGHTTSLDCLWMGVPVVTLVGARVVARAGWSQLSNLGLTGLAATTPEQFVTIAVGLAKNISNLPRLRTSLRERMERSPLMDGPKFARSIESEYRKMWQAWCMAQGT
jgi:protein O-GlcNAc transferase